MITILVTACAPREGEEAPPPPAAPPSYRHLLPLRLRVARIVIALPPRPEALRVMPPAPLIPAELVRLMGEDRLQPAGETGTARFQILTATLLRENAGRGGLFAPSTERIMCQMRCRLEIVDEGGEIVGFIEAEARRSALLPADTPALQAHNAEEVVRRTGDDLNVEFEYQLRRHLRTFLVEAEAAPTAREENRATESPQLVIELPD